MPHRNILLLREHECIVKAYGFLVVFFSCALHDWFAVFFGRIPISDRRSGHASDSSRAIQVIVSAALSFPLNNRGDRPPFARSANGR
jgi:uncharacterized membrane protein